MKKHTLLGPAIVLALWILITQFNLIDTFFLPSPFSTIQKLFQLLLVGSIESDILSTLWRVGVAFGLAIFMGVPLGLVLGISEKTYHSFEFLIDFFRSTPATALFPLFLLIFGITDKSKIAAATFAALLIVIFNTAHGVMRTKKSRLLLAKTMGATKMQIFKSILFWESLPQTFIGLRSALSTALVVVIVTEMFIGTSHGLGKLIIDSQITYEIKTMYATILLTGAIGYSLNLFFISLEKNLLHWADK